MAAMVLITPDSTRDDLVTCALHLNDQAKAEARRGYSGVHGPRYAELHANLDLIVSAILAAPENVILGSE